MQAFDVLRPYLAARATFTNEDFAFIEKVFLPRRLETDPSIASRAPQWMLVSYLGLTPETLSRVRKNRGKKS